MTIIECTEERYALNLNPYQIFVFINEKTKPYLDKFVELQGEMEEYELVLLPFDSSEAQQIMDESVDPQLYNVITHSDVVARVMPKEFGDYRYVTETFFKGKNYDFDYMAYKIGQVIHELRNEANKSFVNIIRRFFQYGNEEFSDFIVKIFSDNLKDIYEMSEKYTHIVCTNLFHVAEEFTRDFWRRLNDEQRDQLRSIIKDVLDYTSSKESKAIFADYIYAVFEADDEKPQVSFKNREKKISAPDFNIVISPLKKNRLADVDGDYDIQVVMDSGKSYPLEFRYRGDKMFYLLTLLCQKLVGGLPTKFFKFESSKNAIKNVYNEVFRSGGDVWVNSMAEEAHRLTVCRTHAKSAIEENNFLDLSSAYWCNLETKALYIGPKKKKLQVRCVRLPNERIIINDGSLLTDCLSDLPTFEQIVGYITPNSARVMKVELPRMGRFRDEELEE